MKSRFGATLRVLSGALPAAFAAAGVSSEPYAAHDTDVVRTVGAGFTGLFRALDLVVASPALFLPLGTRAARCGWASAFVMGVCGVLAFDIARELVGIVFSALNRVRRRQGVQDEASPRFASAVSAIAVLCALLGPAWQFEGAAAGGAVTGAMLALVLLRFAIARRPSEPSPGPAERAAPDGMLAALFVLGLALSYEPILFVVALATMTPRLVARLRSREAKAPGFDRASALRAALAFGLGLAPLGLAVVLWSRSDELAIAEPAFLFAQSAKPSPLGALARAEIGAVMLVVGAAGAALSLVVSEARRIALPLILLAAGAALSLVVDAAAGPTRFASTVLVGILGVHVLGATTLGALVLAIARARVPFAEASAALVVVLELVLPVRALDESATRRAGRDAYASAIWNDEAWGTAPPAAVVLVPDRRTMHRVASARVTGALRGDLVFVPAYDVQGRAGRKALLDEPKLAPLYRDVALGSAPEELSLAQLGGERAVLATFDPNWDRRLARHLVPVGLTSRFESSPRGASDRKKALEAFLPSRARLVAVTVSKRDDELADATVMLLRARAIGMAATGEREILSRALDDLRAFAPDDPVGAELVRRMLTTKGTIDVRDLSFSR